MLKVECSGCKQFFYRHKSAIRERMYCSRECMKNNYKVSEETRKLMRLKKLGVVKWNIGKKLSDEHKLKISISHKNSEKCKNWLKELHKNNKGKHYSISTEIKKGSTQNKSLAWKGGRLNHVAGYIIVHSPNHPNRDVGNYVLEHRLVVEKFIERFLDVNEIVHHINGIRNDNRIENLMAFSSNSAHKRFHSNPNSVKPEEITFDGRLIKSY